MGEILAEHRNIVNGSVLLLGKGERYILPLVRLLRKIRAMIFKLPFCALIAHIGDAGAQAELHIRIITCVCRGQTRKAGERKGCFGVLVGLDGQILARHGGICIIHLDAQGTGQRIQVFRGCHRSGSVAESQPAAAALPKAAVFYHTVRAWRASLFQLRRVDIVFAVAVNQDRRRHILRLAACESGKQAEIVFTRVRNFHG